MSARDDILGRVRAALAPTDGARRSTTPRDRRPEVTTAGSVDLFVERVVDYGATVVRCSSGDVGRAIGAALEGRTVIVPAGLPWLVPDAVPDRGQSGLELDRIEAVVTTASVAIAETGTIVLEHGPGQGRRALSLVPDLHVCVVRTGQVVAAVAQAVAVLDPLLPQTWVSGPSATSDIELSRVEGVHGPRTLRVVLVGD